MIQAFTITKKTIDCLNKGSVSVTYTFAGKEGEKELTENFANLPTANIIIEKHQRDWFLSSLEDYINHKKHVIEGANRTDQMTDLKTCWDFYLSANEKLLATICKRFINGYDFFIRILPADSNASYKSSVHNLAQLKLFAEAFLKTVV